MEMYSFPVLEDGIKAIEEKVIELTKKYKEGSIDPIEDDWLSFVNTILDIENDSRSHSESKTIL